MECALVVVHMAGEHDIDFVPLENLAHQAHLLLFEVRAGGVEAGKAVRVSLQIAIRVVMVTRCSQEQHRATGGRARLPGRGIRVVNREELLPVFADAPACVDDVASDEQKIGMLQVRLIRDGPCPGVPAAASPNRTKLKGWFAAFRARAVEVNTACRLRSTR